MTPSCLRISAISPVPVLRGMTTTLSLCRGPLAVTSCCSMEKPKMPAMARATNRVSRPLNSESMPLRRRRSLGGGGGAIAGLMASLGDRGARRGCADP